MSDIFEDIINSISEEQLIFCSRCNLLTPRFHGILGWGTDFICDICFKWNNPGDWILLKERLREWRKNYYFDNS